MRCETHHPASSSPGGPPQKSVFFLDPMLPSPPPSLVQYEPPLSVGEEGATKPKAAAASGKATEAHLEEILNSILPPRYDGSRGDRFSTRVAVPASAARHAPVCFCVLCNTQCLFVNVVLALTVVCMPSHLVGMRRVASCALFGRPTRMWTQEDSSTWLQYVSKEPSSRLDVITLQEALDQRLMHRQAREMGICPVREDLYSQCFGACLRLALTLVARPAPVVLPLRPLVCHPYPVLVFSFVLGPVRRRTDSSSDDRVAGARAAAAACS